MNKLKEYYYQKTKPRIDNNRTKSSLPLRKIGKRINPYRDILEDKAVSVQLDEVLCLLKKKSRIRTKITEARK